MKQIFVLIEGKGISDFNRVDGLPVSEQLLPYLLAHFPQSLKNNNQFEFNFSAATALAILKEFYEKYELSQPQRRIRFRFEKILSELSPEQAIQLVTADVSEHRSRKNSKSLY